MYCTSMVAYWLNSVAMQMTAIVLKQTWGLVEMARLSDPGRLSKNKVRNIRRQINNIKNITNS